MDPSAFKFRFNRIDTEATASCHNTATPTYKVPLDEENYVRKVVCRGKWEDKQGVGQQEAEVKAGPEIEELLSGYWETPAKTARNTEREAEKAAEQNVSSLALQRGEKAAAAAARKALLEGEGEAERAASAEVARQEAEVSRQNAEDERQKALVEAKREMESVVRKFRPLVPKDLRRNGRYTLSSARESGLRPCTLYPCEHFKRFLLTVSGDTAEYSYRKRDGDGFAGSECWMQGWEEDVVAKFMAHGRDLVRRELTVFFPDSLGEGRGEVRRKWEVVFEDLFARWVDAEVRGMSVLMGRGEGKGREKLAWAMVHSRARPKSKTHDEGVCL